jgi:hypothetical protein
MEELAIYSCKFVYIKGSDNTVADALSRYPHTTPVTTTENAEQTTTHPYRSSEDHVHSILHHPDPCHSPLSMITALYYLLHLCNFN